VADSFMKDNIIPVSL